MQYKHGVTVIEKNAGSRQIQVVETSIIGMVVTAEDRDKTVFPDNKPVMLIGASRYKSKAGTQGQLRSALDAISAQCEPMIYCVCVPNGADAAATKTNIINGIDLLKTTSQMFGYKPRIIVAPGWSHEEAVKTKLGEIATKLKAMTYVHLVAETLEDAVSQRNEFGVRRMYGILGEWLRWDTVSNAEVSHEPTAFAAGIRAKIDNEKGWHWSLSNHVVNGVTGIKKPIYFDLTTTDPTDADYLNANGVACLVNNGGYRFFGLRTFAAPDDDMQFEVYARTADILADTSAIALSTHIDHPMSIAELKDLIKNQNTLFQRLVFNGQLIGGVCEFPADFNTKETAMAGNLTIQYRYTPVPPIERITAIQTQTDEFLGQFIAQLSKV